MRTLFFLFCLISFAVSAAAQGVAVRSKDGLSTNLTISGSVTGAPLAVSARPVATYSANRKALLQVTDGTNILAAFGVTSENATNKYGQLELFGGAHAEYDNVTGLHITDTNLWGSPFDPRAALIRVKSVSGNRTNLGYVFLLQTQMGTNTARRTNQTTTYSDSFAIDQGGAVLLGNLGLLADQAPGLTNYGHGEVVIVADAHSTRPGLVFTNESQEWGRLFTAHYILINGSNRTSVVTANGDYGIGTNNPVATAEIFSTDADGALKITSPHGTAFSVLTNGTLTVGGTPPGLITVRGTNANSVVSLTTDKDGNYLSITGAVSILSKSNTSPTIKAEVISGQSSNLFEAISNNVAIASISHGGHVRSFGGTIGAPGLSFQSDPNSGWYPIADNDWGLAMGGVRILEVNGGGLVQFTAGLTEWGSVSDVFARRSATATLRLEATSGVLVSGSKSSQYVRVGGTWFASSTTSNTLDASEYTLYTNNIPVGMLTNNFETVEFWAGGTFANTAITKNLRVKLGATTIFASGDVAFTAGEWFLNCRVMRTGNSAQKCITALNTSGASTTVYTDYATATESDVAAIPIYITGDAGAGAGAAEIVLEMVKGSWQPAP